MATPNYSYEKRQRDLEKKRKQEEKRQRKVANRKDGKPDESGAEPVSKVADPSDT